MAPTAATLAAVVQARLLRRPRRFHHGLLGAMCLSALSSLNCWAASKAVYRRKLEEGEGHKQEVLALSGIVRSSV